MIRSTDISGTWRVFLEPSSFAPPPGWFLAGLPGSNTLTLPGSTDEAGYGIFTSAQHTAHLTRRFAHVGPVWYQRDIEVPEAWSGYHLKLFLERPHWESSVWVGDRYMGRQNSLCVPHEYQLGPLPCGGHRLTVKVDNTIKIGVGDALAANGTPNLAHSITDHTQTNWNGVVGRLELHARTPCHVQNAQVYPDVAERSVRLTCTLSHEAPANTRATLTVSGATHAFQVTETLSIETGARVFETIVRLGATAEVWDEFSPFHYQLHITLHVGDDFDTFETAFGLRDFRTRGTQFGLNGRPVFLRGTLECCVFPLTGYPEMNSDGWRRVYQRLQAYGLNHVRFHSYCPPEAAFIAADELGMMLHVETPVWAELGSDPVIDAFIRDEGQRILRAYGNHPSFCLLAVGNEPSGDKMHTFLSDIVASWKADDPRRAYTSCAGWPAIPESDYHSTPEPRAYHWGEGLASRFNARPLSTAFDYESSVAQSGVPIVSHEIGQWCSYPNLAEIPKYTGSLEARNYVVVRDHLEACGFLSQAPDFTRASGKLQVQLYKEEIEASLRTRGYGGFQLLGLQDFPGQGTAPVGIIDAFYDDKGYVTAEDFQRFCGPTVPLLRARTFVWRGGDIFCATPEIAHYGPHDLPSAQLAWRIRDDFDQTLAQGSSSKDVPTGTVTTFGELEVPFPNPTDAKHYTLAVSLNGEYANSWSLWLYPALSNVQVPEHITVTRSLEVTATALQAGGTVLLIPEPATVCSDVQLGFSTIFWNTPWTNGQPPHTLGILCDPQHGALRHFPTAEHSDWQWWEIVRHARSLELTGEGSILQPIIQVIDDWNTNRKLSLVFEVRVGRGRLMVVTADLLSQLDARPVARQLLYSLVTYLAEDPAPPLPELSWMWLTSCFEPSTATGHVS